MTIIRHIDNGDDNTRVSAPIVGCAKSVCRQRPRWAAQETRRMTLWENEIATIVEMRRKGRTFSYIATARVKSDRRARRGRGFWWCFD
jgi:hypothetical protein